MQNESFSPPFDFWVEKKKEMLMDAVAVTLKDK